MKTSKEIIAPSTSGWLIVVASILEVIYFVIKIYGLAQEEGSTMAAMIVYSIIGFVIFILLLSCLVVLKPRQGTVFTFAGNYVGSLKGPRFATVPFWWGDKRRNLATEQFDIGPITVNDKNGNPIMIGCSIFTHEEDTYTANFEIHDLKKFLHSKGDVALRSLAMKHPMDAKDEEVSLRGNSDKVSEELLAEVTSEFEKAGYEVEGAKITTLTYAPEIAGMMLQRQQAKATVDARTTIVEGAVAIIKTTIEKLESENVVKLDEVNKQKLVSGLLITLCSSQPVSPVLEVKNG